VIALKDIRFVPYVSVVPVGASVRFVNKDGFDHHVRSQASCSAATCTAPCAAISSSAPRRGLR